MHDKNQKYLQGGSAWCGWMADNSGCSTTAGVEIKKNTTLAGKKR